MQLTELISAIQTTHEYTQRFAVQQTNVALTIRNWVIGFYIVEYEQQGSDKAAYGDRAMKELASRLKHIKGISEPQLYRYREFYLSYPQILSTALRILQGVDFQRDETSLALPSVFSLILEKLATAPNVPLDPDQSCAPELLLSRLSFSHFIELIRADTPLKRAFYEVQYIKNNWSKAIVEPCIRLIYRQLARYCHRNDLVMARSYPTGGNNERCSLLHRWNCPGLGRGMAHGTNNWNVLKTNYLTMVSVCQQAFGFE